ncbi:MAG: hypothetical protein AMXMBFR20_10990 [Planctomycetia bacterium]
MTTKVGVFRKWLEPVPLGRDGKSIPQKLWPQRRRHCWIVRWFAIEADGRESRPSKRFDTRQDAEAFAAEKQDELNKTPTTRRNPEAVTLGEFILTFEELRVGPRGKRLKISSLTSSLYALRRFAGIVGERKMLAEITESDAIRFFNRVIDGGMSKASVGKLKRTLRAAFNVAIKPCRYLRENPFAGMKGESCRGTKRYVSRSEYAAILAACGKLPADHSAWWKAFLAVAYTAGLRYSEIVHLTIGDIDIDAETIKVTTKPASSNTLEWTPKSGRSLRTIPVPSRTIEALLPLYEACPEGHPYVFISPERLAVILAAREAGMWKEGQAVLNNVRRSFHGIVLKAAEKVRSLRRKEGESYQPTASIHDLRRSAITNWSRAVNPQTLQMLAGHDDIKTTMDFYAQTTEDQLELARAASMAAMEGEELPRTDPGLTPEADEGEEKPVSELGRAGIEPATHGFSVRCSTN